MSCADRYDARVLNDDIDRAAEELIELVRG